MYTPRMNPLQNSIFDIFRAGGQQPQQNTPQNQPQNTGQPNNPGNIPDPNNPNPQNNANNSNTNVNDPNQQTNKNVKPNGDANASPMADFASLWETPPAPKEGEALPPDWDDFSSIVPSMKVDPKKLLESARRIDFSKVMNPERVKAALGGDVGAFSEVINSVMQAAFANSAMSMTKITESMSRQMAEKLYSGALPHHFKKHQVNTTVDSENPIFQDPAVAPVLAMVKSQMQIKYPKASAAEISKMAKQYVEGFAKKVTGQGNQNQPGSSKGNQNSKAGEDIDWMEFMSNTPQQ